MLTLESKYSEFIDLCISKAACTRAIDSITEVDNAQEGGETIGEGIAVRDEIEENRKKQGDIIAITTVTSQTLTDGNTVTIPAFKITVNDVT